MFGCPTPRAHGFRRVERIRQRMHCLIYLIDAIFECRDIVDIFANRCSHFFGICDHFFYYAIYRDKKMLGDKCAIFSLANAKTSAEDVAASLPTPCDIGALKKQCRPWGATPATWSDVTRQYGEIPCSTTGLTWECSATRPSGTEVTDAALRAQLQRGKREFSESETAEFGVTVGMDSYVQTNESYCVPYTKRVCRPSSGGTVGTCMDSARYRANASLRIDKGQDVSLVELRAQVDAAQTRAQEVDARLAATATRIATSETAAQTRAQEVDARLAATTTRIATSETAAQTRAQEVDARVSALDSTLRAFFEEANT